VFGNILIPSTTFLCKFHWCEGNATMEL